MTAPGRKIVASRIVNSRPRPGNRNRANPYATSVHESTVPKVPIADSRIVFRSRSGKLIRSQTVW